MTSDANAVERARVEQAALRFCKKNYGATRVEAGAQIHADIKWRPTFYFRRGPVIFAVEVNEAVDVTIFKLAASDVLNFKRPVTMCLACPVTALQTEAQRANVKELRKLGVGLLVVDADGDVDVQLSSIPLAQHISEEVLTDRLRELSARLKIAFRAAHDTFRVNPGQGLQEAGQIVEAIVDSIAAGALRSGRVPPGAITGTAAERIDALWDPLKQHRAALGGARAFLKTYRNTASHPAHSAKEAMNKINRCREGFLQAITVASELKKALKTLGYTLRLHVT